MSDSVSGSGAPMSRMPRWIWPTLVISIAINLLLIGLITGAAVLRHRWGGPVVAGAAPFGYLRTLPKERREQIRQISRERLATLRPIWQAAGEERREADRLFSSEPFDAERFVAAHHRMIETETTARKTGSRLMAEAGARMSLEERRGMLQWRDRRGRRGRDANTDAGGGLDAPPKRP